MKTFENLNLAPSLLKAVRAMGYGDPTPIQEQAIPAALSKRDLIGLAQTGSGKTAAFCIPLITRLLSLRNKTGLILVPTRELAQQIEQVWKELTQFTPEMNSATLIGGMPMPPQTRMLEKNPKLIIATPGRLVDHLGRGSVSLSGTEVLVLDEADRMLDMGFAPQLTQILRFLPKARQTMLFSATWDKNMDRLSSQYLKDPIRVTVGAQSQATPNVSQDAISATIQTKNDILLDKLNQTQGPVLVFARTQARTDRVARYLTSFGLKVSKIHGGRTQFQRNNALLSFKTGKVRIMVATDIAARGIDVAGISHVINYDLPQAPEDYIHRIGRTARAGASGQATSFVTPEDRPQWKQILKLLKNTGSAVPELRTIN